MKYQKIDKKLLTKYFKIVSFIDNKYTLKYDNGINTIKIVAVAEDGSQLDADEDLTVYNPGADTLHKINIDASEPEIAIEDSLNRPIASGIGGTQDTYLCVSASDTATGLAKLEIYKDGNIWFADMPGALTKGDIKSC